MTQHHPMTLERFTALDREQKEEATLTGVCIGGRTEGRHLVLLYQLTAFYVEVYYNKVHHFISDLVAFDSTERLAPYLEKVNLNGVMA